MIWHYGIGMPNHTIESVAPFFTVAFLATFLANYACNVLGRRHYDVDNNTEIFDLGHIVLPRWRVKPLESLVLELGPLLFVFVRGVGPVVKAMPDFLYVFGMVLLLRVLTTMATILPRDRECDTSQLGIKEIITGFCYDKLFSGHTALGVIVAMTMVKHGIWSPGVAWIYPVWMALYVLLTRGHYTADVLLGAIIAFLLFSTLVAS